VGGSAGNTWHSSSVPAVFSLCSSYCLLTCLSWCCLSGGAGNTWHSSSVATVASLYCIATVCLPASAGDASVVVLVIPGITAVVQLCFRCAVLAVCPGSPCPAGAASCGTSSVSSYCLWGGLYCSIICWIVLPTLEIHLTGGFHLRTQF